MTWRKNRKSFPYWLYNLRFKGFRVMDWPQVSSVKNTFDFDFLLSSPLTWIGNGLSLLPLDFFFKTEIKHFYSWRATLRGLYTYLCHFWLPLNAMIAIAVRLIYVSSITMYCNTSKLYQIQPCEISFSEKKFRFTYLSCVCLF